MPAACAKALLHFSGEVDGVVPSRMWWEMRAA
jgi:hypothetical protein